MIQRAGLGVAYHAKPVVAAAAGAAIDHNDLTALLYLQGYTDARLQLNSSAAWSCRLPAHASTLAGEIVAALGLRRPRGQEFSRAESDVRQIAVAVDQHQLDLLARLGVGIDPRLRHRRASSPPGSALPRSHRRGGNSFPPPGCRHRPRVTTTPWTSPPILNLARAPSSSAPSGQAQLRQLGLGSSPARGGNFLPGLSGLASSASLCDRDVHSSACLPLRSTSMLTVLPIGVSATMRGKARSSATGLLSKPVTRSPLLQARLLRRAAAGHVRHQRALGGGQAHALARSPPSPAGCARRSSRAAPRRTGAAAPPPRAPDWREWRSRCRRCRPRASRSPN